MVRAVVCSSQICASRSPICRTNYEARKPDFFSGKHDLSLSKGVVVRLARRSPVVCAAERIRSSSEASTDPQTGRYYSTGWIAQPRYVLGCSVDVERLVHESVQEIVRNIQDAPFLQYVFESKSQRRFVRPQRQKLSPSLIESPNCWPSIRESLSKVDPDGVILVQKLEPRCLAETVGGDETVCPLQGHDREETSVWGVLVQGRNLHTHACYLLETTSVSSSAGICTRYCLTRATCFGPSHFEQLENAWLL